MNDRQLARWAADVLSDLQRLQKAAAGHAMSPALARAAEALREARAQALASPAGGEEDPGDGGAR